ncbi:MAG: hypothetical protein QOE90_1217 [Thermoplasmata archaeon]|nr:hypothetical protein [Thermoplasmata archaeon]
MTRVQFREDDDVVAYVASAGLNPNEVAKRAFEDEVRRLKARQARAKLRKLNAPAIDGAAAVREIRDDA